MAVDDSYAELMHRLHAGDEDAAAQIFERFAQRLIALARSRLDPLMRQKMDPEDVLQSVFESFFARQVQGQATPCSWDSLWGLLAVITIRKCNNRLEFFRAARRDIRREVSSAPAASNAHAYWEAIAREPTPSEAAMLTETLEQLMGQLGARDRHIVALYLQGFTTPEISNQAGCTERTVQRVLERVRGWLQRKAEAEND